MISAVSSWAGSIVMAVIIVTILEMILPEGKNKKYIKTVLGVYLLFTVVSPIIKAVSGEEIKLENIFQMEKEMSKDSTNEMNLQTNHSIETIYETNLKKDIEVKLQQRGYEASEMLLQIEWIDEQNYGKIHKISMQLDKKKTEEKAATNTTINQVETIQIQVGNKQAETKEKREQISDKEKQEIKEYLSNTYDIEETNITIF